MSKGDKLTTGFTAFDRNFYFKMWRAALGWNFNIIIMRATIGRMLIET
jgi:hypothetical protein